jgi:hypothetical protein
MTPTGEKRKANENENDAIDEKGRATTNPAEETTKPNGSAGAGASLPSKKPRRRRMIGKKEVADRIRVMFEDQAQLWKRHANLIDKATTSTLRVSEVLQHQPWLAILDTTSVLPPQDQLKPNRAVDLNRTLDNLQTRTKQTLPMPKKRKRAKKDDQVTKG